MANETTVEELQAATEVQEPEAAAESRAPESVEPKAKGRGRKKAAEPKVPVDFQIVGGIFRKGRRYLPGDEEEYLASLGKDAAEVLARLKQLDVVQ